MSQTKGLGGALPALSSQTKKKNAACPPTLPGQHWVLPLSSQTSVAQPWPLGDNHLPLRVSEPCKCDLRVPCAQCPVLGHSCHWPETGWQGELLHAPSALAWPPQGHDGVPALLLYFDTSVCHPDPPVVAALTALCRDPKSLPIEAKPKF